MKTKIEYRHKDSEVIGAMSLTADNAKEVLEFSRPYLVHVRNYKLGTWFVKDGYGRNMLRVMRDEDYYSMYGNWEVFKSIQEASSVDQISDPVSNPSHYTFGKFEVIDVLEDWFAEQPLLWQVAKYIARAKHKGNYLQDLKKAQFYLSRAIAKEEARIAETSH